MEVCDKNSFQKAGINTVGRTIFPSEIWFSFGKTYTLFLHIYIHLQHSPKQSHYHLLGLLDLSSVLTTTLFETMFVLNPYEKSNSFTSLPSYALKRLHN